MLVNNMLFTVGLATLAMLANRGNSAWILERALLVLLAISLHVWFEHIALQIEGLRDAITRANLWRATKQLLPGLFVVVLLVSGSFMRCCQFDGREPFEACEHVALDVAIVIGTVIALRRLGVNRPKELVEHAQ